SRILSLGLPGATLLLAALAFFWTPGIWLAGAGLVTFLLVNSGFFFYSLRRKGLAFAVGSILFLFVEMLWAIIGLLFSGFR
ncbi:MAG: hypothetical protein ACWGQW_09210, partial [bacterium]